MSSRLERVREKRALFTTATHLHWSVGIMVHGERYPFFEDASTGAGRLPPGNLIWKRSSRAFNGQASDQSAEITSSTAAAGSHRMVGKAQRLGFGNEVKVAGLSLRVASRRRSPITGQRLAHGGPILDLNPCWSTTTGARP